MKKIHWTHIILINSGADLEAKDQNGWTPLFWAARFGYTEVVKLLVSKGAAKDLKNKHTPTLTRSHLRIPVHTHIHLHTPAHTPNMPADADFGLINHM